MVTLKTRYPHKESKLRAILVLLLRNQSFTHNLRKSVRHYRMLLHHSVPSQLLKIYNLTNYKVKSVDLEAKRIATNQTMLLFSIHQLQLIIKTKLMEMMRRRQKIVLRMMSMINFSMMLSINLRQSYHLWRLNNSLFVNHKGTLSNKFRRTNNRLSVK